MATIEQARQLTIGASKEIRSILEQNEDDRVTRKQVHAFAIANPESATHAWLEKHGAFDPEKAMQKWGEHLCGKLIMSVKIYVADNQNELHRVRGMVSLASDRMVGGGYRDTQKVLRNDDLRREMELTALKEYKALSRKHEILTALAPIREAIEKVEKAIA